MNGQEFKDPLLQVYCEGMKMKCAWKREQWYSDKLLQQPSLSKLSVPVRDLTITNVWQYANKWKYIAIWMRFQDKHIKSAVPQTLYYPLASFSL